MGYEQPLFKVGLYASDTDRSALTNQYTGVAIGVAQKIVGAGQGNAALVAAPAGGSIIGVLQNNPLQGEAGELTVKGITKARAGGSFTVGDDLAVDGNGLFVKNSGQTSVALALEQAVAGDVTSILLK